MVMKKLWISISVAVLGVIGLSAAVAGVVGENVYAANDCGLSILPSGWCNKEEGDNNGIWQMLSFVLEFLNYAVGILAGIGLVIAAVQYTTASDSPDKVAAAKKRIFDIVLGLIIYACLAIFADFLLPGGLI